MEERFRVPDEIAVRVAAADMRATVEGIFGALQQLECLGECLLHGG